MNPYYNRHSESNRATVVLKSSFPLVFIFPSATITDFKHLNSLGMWFELGFQDFLAKKNHSIDSCDIFVSDCNRIWHKKLSNNEILSISKELNPLLEASVQKLKDIILKLLQDVAVQKEIQQNDNNITFKLQSHILGVKFQFEVFLEPGDADMFYKEFTLPLLLLIMNFKNREEKLLKIIEDKDAEIEDFKKEYGPRANYLSTKPFIKKEFDSVLSDKSFFNAASFLHYITTKLTSHKGITEVKQEDQSLAQGSGARSSVEKCDKNKSIFKDSISANKGSKPFVFLDNQTIKKRRKYNDGFKIRF